jgi:hypothetical protein
MRWDAALAVGRGALWSPTIRCAVIADMPWRQARHVRVGRAPILSGLFVLNRHDLFAIETSESQRLRWSSKLVDGPDQLHCAAAEWAT